MPMQRLSAEDQVLVWPDELRDRSADGGRRQVMISVAGGAVTGTELRRMSATELAEAIGSGQVWSREVTEAHLRRVEAVNPLINVVTVVLIDPRTGGTDR